MFTYLRAHCLNVRSEAGFPPPADDRCSVRLQFPHFLASDFRFGMLTLQVVVSQLNGFALAKPIDGPNQQSILIF